MYFEFYKLHMDRKQDFRISYSKTETLQAALLPLGMEINILMFSSGSNNE